MYDEKKSAMAGVESVQRNAGAERQYETRESKKKEPYFVLLAKNGEVIGKSEMYKSKKGCRNGIVSSMKFGPDAKVVDLNPV